MEQEGREHPPPRSTVSLQHILKAVNQNVFLAGFFTPPVRLAARSGEGSSEDASALRLRPQQPACSNIRVCALHARPPCVSRAAHALLYTTGV